MTSVDQLLDLLPVHVQARDEETGGTLHALLVAVSDELDVIERDLDDLYQSWFVETAAPWALPYLADLLGIDDLPAGTGRRAVVANTVDYRRRKGTAAVVEQVAHDVTGWPARAVEYLRLLATTAHVNHVRPDRPAVADIRRAADLGSPHVARGSLDPAMHTAEVRRIARGRGRYGIGNVGVFVFPHQVYAVERAPAVASVQGWSVHPLGLPTPLFAVPTDEDTIEHHAVEADLPLPLRPRRLLALLQAARSGSLDPGALPLQVAVNAADLPGETWLEPQRVRICGLEDLVPGLAGWQVMVDAAAGRIATYQGGAPIAADPDPDTAEVIVHVRHAYGGTADVGAGTYDRTEVHDDALASDGYVRKLHAEVAAQHVVRLDSPAPGSTDPIGPSLPNVLALVAKEWEGTAAPGGSIPTAGTTTVVSVGDSGSWTGDITVDIPPATRLVLVAATWTQRLLANDEVLPPVPGQYAPVGLRPHVRGTLTVTGGPGSALVVDGFVLEGDLAVTAGSLAALTVSQATVTGTVRVTAGPVNRNNDLRVRLLRAMVGGVSLAATVPEVAVADSVVSAEVGGGPSDGTVLRAPGAHLAVTGSTVRGDVEVRTFDASDAVLDGRVGVDHRQTGCVRYTYLGPGSRVPRRFRCVPASDAASAPSPAYVSDERGSPSFLALAPSCPAEIRTGAEGGAEMGVHFHLQRPVRVAAAQRMLAGYVPAGLEIGVVRDG